MIVCLFDEALVIVGRVEGVCVECVCVCVCVCVCESVCVCRA